MVYNVKIEAICVKQELRKQGIGKALIERCFSDVRNKQKDKGAETKIISEIETFTTNEPLKQFAGKTGFSKTVKGVKRLLNTLTQIPA